MSIKNQRDTLRKIQLIQLEILKHVSEICESNNLRYSLSFGTLLGAVRHGGFIPWDDDIDIDMPREDYERFLEIADKKLSNKYYIQNYSTDKYCLNCAFTKIRKNGTVHESEGQKHLNRHKGVSMDIFPVDIGPADIKKQEKHKRNIQFLKSLVSVKLKYNYYNDNFASKYIKIVGSFLMWPIPISLIGRIMEKTMRRYEKSKDGVNVNAHTNINYLPTTFDSKIYGKSAELKFEGYKFKAPENWEQYLLNIYGDYKQLPPENQRYNYQHNIVKIEL